MSRQYLTHTTHTHAHASDIFSLAVHRPSATLLSASGSSSLQVHSTYSPPYLPDPDSLDPSDEAFPHTQTLSGAHKLGCHHVAASREGKRAASAGFGGEVRVWRWNDVDAAMHNGSGSTPDPRTDGHQAGFWELEGTIHDDCKAGDVWAIALSSDGQYLASTSMDGRVNVWDLDASPSSSSAVDTNDTPNDVNAGPTSTETQPTTKPKRARSPRKKPPSTDKPIGAKLRQYDTGKSFGMAIDISPSGTLTATGHQKGSLHLLNNSTSRMHASLLSLAGPVRAVKFSPAETFLAAAGDGRIVALYSTRSGEQVALLEGHTSWVFDLDFNANGTLLVSGGWAGEVRVWDVERRECVSVVKGDEGKEGSGAGAAVWGVKWVRVGRGEGFVCAGRRGDLGWWREAASG
ncbi:MAG: superkiller [Chrysothrix sp. TS-e1954]|nr:MAG: superkiller [Chrysothrix sp. TS-e1954]